MKLSGPSTGLNALQTRKIPRTCRRWKHRPQCCSCTTSVKLVHLRSVSSRKFTFDFLPNRKLYSYDTGTHEVLCIWQVSSHFLTAFFFTKKISIDLQPRLNTSHSSHVVVCWVLFAKLAYAMRNWRLAEPHTPEQDLILLVLWAVEVSLLEETLRILLVLHVGA